MAAIASHTYQELSETRLRRIIDNMNTFIAELDLEGHIHEINEVALRSAGLKREDVIGAKFWDCYWWTYDDEVVDRLKAAFLKSIEGETVRYDEAIRISGDERITVEVMLSPVRDAEGKITHIIPSGVDISARKVAEDYIKDQEKKFRETFENAAVGMAHVAKDGRWLRVNDRLCKITGYSHEEFYQMTFQDITHPDDMPADTANKARLRRGVIDYYQMEKRYFCKNGEIIWVKLTVSTAGDMHGDETFFIAIIEDISESKKLETQVARESERKSQFLATLSHELRNPLTPINNAFSLLERNNLPDEKREQLIATGKRSTEHLVRLVEDLLDITRINRGKIELQKNDCRFLNILEEAMEETRSRVEERGQTLTLACDEQEEMVIYGDCSRLRQVFSNILNNANKYTPQGGVIEIFCCRKEGAVEVVIQDDGPGVPIELLDDIFEIFVQAEDPLKRSESGLGIGLALVKEMVGLHGGKVKAENRAQGGMRFTVLLPLKE